MRKHSAVGALQVLAGHAPAPHAAVLRTPARAAHAGAQRPLRIPAACSGWRHLPGGARATLVDTLTSNLTSLAASAEALLEEWDAAPPGAAAAHRAALKMHVFLLHCAATQASAWAGAWAGAWPCAWAGACTCSCACACAHICLHVFMTRSEGSRPAPAVPARLRPALSADADAVNV